MPDRTNAHNLALAPDQGMLDRFIVTQSMAGQFEDVQRVIAKLQGRMIGLETILKDEPHHPSKLKAQNEARGILSAILVQQSMALEFAQVMHHWALLIEKRQHHRQKAEKRAARLARLAALFAAYWEIEYQLRQEADDRLREYLHQKLEDKSHSIIAKAIHHMSDLIARVMETEGTEEEAVRIVATAFVTNETVSRALDQLKSDTDADVQAFAEHLTAGDAEGKITLVAEITDNVLMRDVRRARLQELMEAPTLPDAPAPELRPEALQVDLSAWMDTLLEIKLMGLIRELGPALNQHPMKGFLKIKAHLLDAMNDSLPRTRLLQKIEQDTDSVRQQILSHLHANQGLQDALAAPVPMPASGSRGMSPFGSRPTSLAVKPTFAAPRRKEDDERHTLKL